MEGRITQRQISKGMVLLAEPFMMESHFGRSVILITDYSASEGAIGFILNKPIELNINDLIKDFPRIESPVYLGGPVSKETLHYIHDRGDIVDDSVKVCSGVYWGGNFEVLKLMINNRLILPQNIKFFLGYSGWSAGQLEDEMECGSWIQARMYAHYAFQTRPEQMWELVMKNKGGNYQVIGKMPKGSFLN